MAEVEEDTRAQYLQSFWNVLVYNLKTGLSGMSLRTTGGSRSGGGLESRYSCLPGPSSLPVLAMGTLLLSRTRTDSVYKLEPSSSGGGESGRQLLSWRVLRWLLIPAMILLLLGTAVYTIIWANQEEPTEIQNRTQISEELLVGRELASILSESSDIRWKEETPSDRREPPSDLMMSDVDETRGTNDTADSYIQEEVSFIDRLINSFQESMEKRQKDTGGLSVRQFTSLGETGYRRVPNGHKYGEYQSLPSITKYLERSTTALPVSPTLPSLLSKERLRPTQAPFNYSESSCHSPQLSMCRGVIPWDLTTVPSMPGVSSMPSLQEAIPYFELILDSGCSPRARQFLCSLLEPECQPLGSTVLPPCRSACKVVAEECNDFILDTLDLSKVFQCANYPDTNDKEECVNFAIDKCLRKEFKCGDGVCIPKRWRCNGVKDCADGLDEVNCTVCNKYQFSCENRDSCIPLDWRCDGNSDCSDGSDEAECQREEDMMVHSHTSPCPQGELRCVDGRCITVQQICDSHKDCSDGADEANCRLSFT